MALASVGTGGRFRGRPRRGGALRYGRSRLLWSRLTAACFSASVKVAPRVTRRWISAALNNTRLPMRMGLSFPVRCSQKSVVSPILKIAKASARVNSCGPVISLRVRLATKVLLPLQNAPNVGAIGRR
jgi:hypothetical protein